MVQLNIDCEGPVTSNDNAFELCRELIPEGDLLFARISRYDDYLADIEKRPGYKAGDTLRLILPFLRAWGCTNTIMEDFSESTLLLLPGTEKMLPFVNMLMPSYIISTSYRPYLEALSRAAAFPMDHVYCTEVDMDRINMRAGEAERLKELATEIKGMPILEWSSDISGPGELDKENMDLIRRLDHIFWKEIFDMESGCFIKEVNPIGGKEKAAAVEDSLNRTGSMLSEVVYAGDSITDVQALELVRKGGGLALSFNGNSYAIKAASWAAISGSTGLIGAVAHLAHMYGTSCFDDIPLDSNGRCEGGKLVDWFMAKGVASEMTDLLREQGTGITPAIISVDMDISDTIIIESEKVRKDVRGIGIGELG